MKNRILEKSWERFSTVLKISNNYYTKSWYPMFRSWYPRFPDVMFFHYKTMRKHCLKIHTYIQTSRIYNLFLFWSLLETKEIHSLLHIESITYNVYYKFMFYNSKLNKTKIPFIEKSTYYKMVTRLPLWKQSVNMPLKSNCKLNDLQSIQ